MMADEERISARDFTVAQAFYRDPCPVSQQHPEGWAHRQEKFVVMSPYVRVARPLAAAYAVERFGGEPHELHLYPRTYVDDARALAAAGRVVSV